MPAGKYFVQSGIPPPGWTFTSAIYQGRDLSEVPLDLESADISGVVAPLRMAHGVERHGPDIERRHPSTTVIVFPSDHTAWTSSGTVNRRRVRGTRTGATGSYKLTGLPAGSYYIAAVPEESAAESPDPKFLETLSATAARVTLDDGERKTQNVRTTRVDEMVATLALVLTLGGAVPDQQPAREGRPAPPSGTAVISGRVVSADAQPKPVRRARVTLNSSDREVGRTAITDDAGTFSFTALPAGRYSLSAIKAGFVNVSYGEKRPGRPGTPIPLTTPSA